MAPTIDEVTFRPVASGNGRLKLPGHAQWRNITLPPASEKITDFRAYGPTGGVPIQSIQESVQPESTSPPELNDSDLLNRLNRLYEASRGHPEISESIQFNTPESDDSKRKRIAELKLQGLNQNQIIYVIWGAKAGGNRAYREALEEYRRLVGE
jgi:hypothetical protein